MHPDYLHCLANMSEMWQYSHLLCAAFRNTTPCHSRQRYVFLSLLTLLFIRNFPRARRWSGACGASLRPIDIGNPLLRCGSEEKAGVKEETLAVDGGDIEVATLAGVISVAVARGSWDAAHVSHTCIVYQVCQRHINVANSLTKRQ